MTRGELARRLSGAAMLLLAAAAGAVAGACRTPAPPKDAGTCIQVNVGADAGFDATTNPGF